MEILKKYTRSHKYREYLNDAEIDRTLQPYISILNSNEIYNLKEALYRDLYPEIYDIYSDNFANIISRARSDLQTQFRNKIKKNIKTLEQKMALEEYMRNL